MNAHGAPDSPSYSPRPITSVARASVRPGATLAAIAQKLKDLPAGSRVLGFNYDTGERYLSVEGFLPA